MVDYFTYPHQAYLFHPNHGKVGDEVPSHLSVALNSLKLSLSCFYQVTLLFVRLSFLTLEVEAYPVLFHTDPSNPMTSPKITLFIKIIRYYLELFSANDPHSFYEPKVMAKN
jgi:hypothetical protein